MQEKRRTEEMEMQVKMKELELEQLRLSNEKQEIMPFVLPSVHNKFDVAKYITFVPTLEGENIEKIAKSLAWPNEYWTLLLQSILIGKARENNGSLELGKSSIYEEVK